VLGGRGRSSGDLKEGRAQRWSTAARQAGEKDGVCSESRPNTRVNGGAKAEQLILSREFNRGGQENKMAGDEREGNKRKKVTRKEEDFTVLKDENILAGEQSHHR